MHHSTSLFPHSSCAGIWALELSFPRFKCGSWTALQWAWGSKIRWLII
jgi:hypothetical protein